MGGPAHLFRQTISVAELAGRDAYGKPILGPVTSGPARVQPTSKLIRDAKGMEFLASSVIYTTLAVTIRHRVWLPGADTSQVATSHRPARVDVSVDGSGAERMRKVWL